MVRLHFFRVLIYVERHFADLYTLPPNRLTHALADAVAMNFYARVPPNLRPSNLRDRFPDLDADDSQPRIKKEMKSGKALNEKDVVAEKEEVAHALDENATPAMASSALPTASTTVSAVTTNDGDAKQTERNDTAKDAEKKKKSKYPSRPLLAALHATFFWRWWIAGAMKLCAGECSFNYKIIS